jgi:hypothetical protein
LKYQWIHIVDFELLASNNSPIRISKQGGCVRVALLAEDIRDAINLAEKKVCGDNYKIKFISSAERFDAEHYHEEVHENEFLTVEDIGSGKIEVDYVSIIVYD